MERMGKTLFFRSGGEPLILTEEQRELRKQGWSEKFLLSVVPIYSQQTRLELLNCMGEWDYLLVLLVFIFYVYS